ncbi:hypothetical protein WMO28_05430 [Blautia sp. CLA-JM-H16]|uniref:Glycosyl hydrolase 94 catalytic domain-containing protein n=1 Tax=Blautia aquisgranensis TaxID=3133153 RepID=A0ABV1BCN4_9FIRM
MKFGYFDDEAREYVITTPRTPLPWINYLGSQDFFSLISNTGGGYSFYKDAKLLRITRYRYNDIPNDSNGKYYYINDNGTVWNPGFMPSRTELDSYECRHGMGYTRFKSSKNGLGAELLAFVPVDAACEINLLTLENTSSEEKSFSLFSYVEFCLWNAMDDMTNFQRNLSIGEVEIEDSTIYHKTEYRERRNHYSFFTVNTSVDGFDTSRDDFLGAYNSNAIPDAVRECKCHNSIASGWYPAAVHQINLWLIAAVAAYLKETGDASILDAQVPFDCKPGTEETLFEHLRRSFQYTADHLGPHKLPLIGRADWNDCLNLNCFSSEPGESFQTTGPSEGSVAESVFIAGMFVKYGDEFAKISKLYGNTELSEKAEKEVKNMYQAILDAGWDGSWFLRAYDAASEKIGSSECKEGQIFIEPQGFCVMAGVGVKEGLAEKALDSVKERLYTKYGIMLLQPAYTRYYLNLGEISSYPPGYKENAGIFCHNNPWVSIAETVIGRGNRAYEIYSKTCPSCIEDISEIHRTEPYVYSQMVAGADAARHGEAKNSWLTGTAAWTFVNLSQAILGVCPDYEGLRIDPCIPEGFGDFTITRIFRDAVYHIQIKNPSNVQKGITHLNVDGKEIDGNIIPYEADKKEYFVTAYMG